MTTDISADTAGTMLDKTFDPAAIEAKWYAHWERSGLFRPERPDAPPFTIVNPPPNVTGSLHIGHALDNTLQDIVIRYERLRGKDALWVVGTDHAGIATQMVVERQLEANGDKRSNYSREAFIDKVWEWKATSGGTITGQLRRLGCSMDWSREQFTMDPHFTKAVVKVFVDLYNTKDETGRSLIYRDKRLVNWDPKLKTAISDLEVETREIQGGFWHFRYPLADGVTLANGADHIVVATTRPETMLADMAVAVNAADLRYQSVIGKFIEQPLTGRRLRIVADEHADPELGSGAVKITPGHDFNDFEVGKRAGIKPADMLNMFDAEARVVQCRGIPDEFLELDRFDARKLVVQMMKKQGFLVPYVDKDGNEHDAEPRTIQTPYGDRGGVVIEPWLTDQWYVDAEKLAVAPMEAVRSGAIEIVPNTWEKTFFNWMENIQPWCVSRQLWWGHRIPAWYGPPSDVLQGGTGTGQIFVANDEKATLGLAKDRYPEGTIIGVIGYSDRALNPDIWLRRDNDVLDTWFSSALWPFATLGWPDATLPPQTGEGDHAQHGGGGVPPGASVEGHAAAIAPSTAVGGPPPRGGEESSLLARHYPNDLLISGFDILFFWCARMAMMGMKLNDGQVPWKRLYLHGLVRAADGAKMSKSKGNVVDPLVLIDKYGADALRFFMAAMESQGRDVKMDERRVEGYRNFATKLWNAARFCQNNGIGGSASVAAPPTALTVNKWIIGEVVETVAELDKAMAELRFDAAANIIYHFVWDNFCDWYIELIKGSFDDETKAVAGWVLDQILVMLHPFMPFVTEELWGALAERRYELIVAQWPEPKAAVDRAAKVEVEWLIELVSQIRATRSELNIPPSAKLPISPIAAPEEIYKLLDKHAIALERIARVEQRMGISQQAQVVAGGATFALEVGSAIDIAAEKARLEKALAASEKEAKSLAGRLGNPAFVEKAKPEAVDKARADHAAHAAEAERLRAALARLG